MLRYLPKPLPLPELTFGRIVISLALFVISLLIFDCVASGSILQKNVVVNDQKRNFKIKASLPFSSASYDVGDQYTFVFKHTWSLLDGLFPIYLVADDCIKKLEINGQLINPKAAGAKTACPYGNTVSVDMAEFTDVFKVLVEDDTKQNFGLQLVRSNFSNPLTRLIIVCLITYFASLHFVRSWKVLKNLHYTLFVSAIFIASLFPSSFDFYEWTFWFGYFGNGLAIAAVVMLGIKSSLIRKIYYGLDRQLKRIRTVSPVRYISACTLCFFILCACLSQILFGGLPHVADTHIQYVQSKIFASGYFYLTSHPFKGFFDFQNAINDGKYYGVPFPGHPLILAIGQLLDVPWLINPLMGSLTVFMVFLLAKELGGVSAGYIASALMLVSPAVVFMSSEYMNHVTSMFFLSLFVYAYIRLCKTGNWRFAVLAGGCVGYAFITRAQAAIPFGFPIAMHACFVFIRNWREKYVPFLCLVGSFSLFLFFIFYYNYETTGDPFFIAYVKNTGGYDPWEYLHASRWLLLGDDIRRAIDQTIIVHKELFAWPTSSLIFVFILYLFKAQPRYASILLACVFGQFWGLVFLHRDMGAVFLPRYIYESFSLLIVLTAVAIQRLPVILRRYLNVRVSIQLIRPMIATTVISFVFLAFPYRITELYSHYGNNFWEGDSSYYYMLSSTVKPPALVFMKSYIDYRKVYFTMPPLDTNPIIFALDRAEKNQKLIDYYPDRHVYSVDGWHVKKLK